MVAAGGDEDVTRTHEAEAVNARVVLKLLKELKD